MTSHILNSFLNSKSQHDIYIYTEWSTFGDFNMHFHITCQDLSEPYTLRVEGTVQIK